MLMHRPTLLLYVLAMIALYFVQSYFGLWPMLILSAAYVAWLTYASLNFDLDFYVKAYHKGNTEDKVVALTFDDGPDPSCTPVVLDILKERNVKATFFLIGKKIEASEVLVKRIDSEGHIIGNHSFVHQTILTFIPSFLVRRDLNKTTDLIETIIGKRTDYFRPPFGVTTPAIGWALSIMKIKTIGWNIRTFDTYYKDEEKILQRIKDGLEPGSIILLHDVLPIYKTLLPKILDLLEERSYKVVPLDKLIKCEPYLETKNV